MKLLVILWRISIVSWGVFGIALTFIPRKCFYFPMISLCSSLNLSELLWNFRNLFNRFNLPADLWNITIIFWKFLKLQPICLNLMTDFGYVFCPPEISFSSKFSHRKLFWLRTKCCCSCPWKNLPNSPKNVSNFLQKFLTASFLRIEIICFFILPQKSLWLYLEVLFNFHWKVFQGSALNCFWLFPAIFSNVLWKILPNSSVIVF